MSSTTLPVLALAHPLILLPASRLVVPVDRSTGLALLDLLSEAEPLLAAVPVVPSPDKRASAYTLNEWGTAARILRLIKNPSARRPDQLYLVTLEAVTPSRVRLSSLPTLASSSPGKLLHLSVEYPPPGEGPSPAMVEPFRSAALALLDRLAKDTAQTSKRDSWTRLAGMVEDMSTQRALWMADVLVATTIPDYNDRLEYLSAVESDDRLKHATQMIVKQTSISEVSKKIASEVNETLSKQQKEYYLRQQMAAIQRELQQLNRSSGTGAEPTPAGNSSLPSSELDDDDQQDADDLADIKRKIEAMEAGSEERKTSVREWKRMKRIQSSSVEHGVIRSYLEWITAIPWPTSAVDAAQLEAIRDRAFLSNAKRTLDADHFGLDKIKRRLIEYLAVFRLKQTSLAAQLAREQTHPADMAGIAADGGPQVLPTVAPQKGPVVRRGVKGPILLFVGPPGVGKTSLGQSVARALNRPFQRISLGGVRDEAEIRGHRRTYVASGPGVIVQALRKAGRLDPVILLDEIDKIGQSSFHGDPAAALLEVLDPEQNHAFKDHYINVPVDLSQVLFICTSNTLDTISAPLLDRCEVIQLSGYTHDEKLHIARRFLLPKQLESSGMDAERVDVTEAALARVIQAYTREAGVRSLERAIGSVVRAKVVEWAEFQDASEGQTRATDGRYQNVVNERDLEKILGVPWWNGDEMEREERRGLVYGLVVSGLGEGGILPVETTAVPGTGKLTLTGSLGDVIKESGEIALSWVKSHAYGLGVTTTSNQDPLKFPNPIDVHLHLPSGAQKKDGPSAGIAMTCAFVSLFTGHCIPTNVAMTGEVTLRGRVTPVGGIKEKVLGAHRAQITKVILPSANRKDVEHDIALEIRNSMEFVFVHTVEEVIKAAFGEGIVWPRKTAIPLESRL